MTMNDISDIACNDQGFDVAVDLGPGWRIDAGAEHSMDFSYNTDGLIEAVKAARKLPGVFYIRVWLNEGTLNVGDSIMYVLIGADIRPHAVDALQQLVGIIKNDLVVEHENYE